MKIVGAVWLIACFFALGKGNAAEAELIEFYSFVNPTVLGATSRVSVAGAPTVRSNRESYRLLTTTVLTGVESQYLFRNEVADTPNVFVRSANNYYSPPWQVALDLTGRHPFDCDSDAQCADLPTFKGRLELSYYSDFLKNFSLSAAGKGDRTNIPPGSATNSSAYGIKDRVRAMPAWHRLQAGWSIEQRFTGEWVNELTLELELFVIPVFGIPQRQIKFRSETVEFFPEFDGGYLYAWRPETREQFLGYGYHFDVLRWSNVGRLKYGIWISGEADKDSWHWAAFRNEAIVQLAALPRHGTFNLGFAVTRDLNRGEWHSQASLFLNIPIEDWAFRRKAK